MTEATLSYSRRMPAQSVVLRHLPLCAMWLVLVVIALGACVHHWPTPALAIDAICLLYTVQGLMAELLGVALQPKAILAPRRLLSSLPFVVFWRKRMALSDIEKIKSLPRLGGLERAVVIGHRDRASILFQDRDERLHFFELVRQLRPWVTIYRGR